MPRESIYAYSDDPNADDVTRLHVSWGRGSFVQLGVDRSETGETGLDTGTSVWTESLSRAQINDLIRVLRKARDQVHGKDE